MRSMTLARFWAAYILELRLIVGHWGYWAVVAVFAVFTLSTFGDPGFQTAESALMVGLGRNSSGLISLITLYLAGFSAARAGRARVATLEASFPTGAEIMTARWLAVVTAALPLMLVPLSIAFAQGPFESFLRGGLLFAFETLLVIAFSSALVWLIVALAGVQRWLYLLLVLLWILPVLVPVLLNDEVAVRLPGASLMNYPRAGASSYTEAFGLLLAGDYPLLFNLFYLGAVPLLVGLIILLQQRERLRRWSRSGAVLSGLALAVVLLSGGAYITSAARVADEAESQSGQTRYVPSERNSFNVGYDIELDLSDTPHVTVVMQITNTMPEPIDTLTFALNEQFTITSSNLDWERDGERLHVTPAVPLAPGETIDWTLSYRGALWDLQYTVGAPPQPTSFIHTDGLRLLPVDAWYPLKREFPRSPDEAEPRQSFAFDITVSGADGMTVAMNLPDADSMRGGVVASGMAIGLVLVGSPRLDVAAITDEIALVASTLEIAMIENAIARHYPPALDIVRRYFSVPQGVKIITAVTERWVGPSVDSGPQPEDVLVIYGNTHSFGLMAQNERSIYSYTTYMLVNAILAPDGMGADSLLIDNIAYFLWTQQQTGGDITTMRAMLDAQIADISPNMAGVIGFSGRPGGSSTYIISEALLAVYAQQGEDGVVAVLDHLRARWDEFDYRTPPDEIVTMIEEVAGVDITAG